MTRNSARTCFDHIFEIGFERKGCFRPRILGRTLVKHLNQGTESQSKSLQIRSKLKRHLTTTRKKSIPGYLHCKSKFEHFSVHTTKKRDPNIIYHDQKFNQSSRSAYFLIENKNLIKFKLINKLIKILKDLNTLNILHKVHKNCSSLLLNISITTSAISSPAPRTGLKNNSVTVWGDISRKWATNDKQ